MTETFITRLMLAVGLTACQPSSTPQSTAPISRSWEPASFWLRGKKISVSKTGDWKHFVNTGPRPCKIRGERRPELLAPILNYVRATLLDSNAAMRFFYEDADSAAFRVI